MYPNVTDVNMTDGLGEMFCYVSVVSSIFFPLLLVCLFLIFGFGQYYIQVRSRGVGDLPQCFSVAGFMTTVFAFILRLVTDVNGVSCLINGATLGVCIVVTSLCVLWLFFSRD